MITCDKCGPNVPAAFLVKLMDGELSFCGHHFHEYSAALEPLAYEVVELNKEEELIEV